MFSSIATYHPDDDDDDDDFRGFQDDDDDAKFHGFASSDDIVDVAVSCDGTWQKRGHRSQYEVQAAISAVTGKVIDYEIESRFCKNCQSHSSWDRGSENYREWKASHVENCSLTYAGSSNSMKTHGAVVMWCRSLEHHKLRYTTFIGDGDSSAYRSVVAANPYGDDVTITVGFVGHVQKRMGTQLRRLWMEHKDLAIPLPSGTVRKGVKGQRRLTADLVNKLQNYYGMAIRSNLGNKFGMVSAIAAIFGHHSNNHTFCPPGAYTWCKYMRGDPTYKEKDTQKEVFELMEPVFLRLSDDALLDRLQCGDTQNSNESLHSLIWKRRRNIYRRLSKL